MLRSFGEAEEVSFSTVLLDEASQCMEAAVLPAIVLGCRRLVLVGDQNQLPPVVQCSEALDRGLGVSMFSRLAAAGMTPSLLNQQYRMHPKIAHFPSTQFYSGLVMSSVSAADRPLPLGYAWPNKDVPVVFIDASAKGVRRDVSLLSGSGFEKMSNSSTSYSNEAEAAVLVGVIESLVSHGGLSLDDIGVISPYTAQVRLLLELCRNKGWVADRLSVEPRVGLRDTLLGKQRKAKDSTDRPVQYLNMSTLSKVRRESVDDGQFYSVDASPDETDNEQVLASTLEVKSVDGYQGREKDVILISAVRSNPFGRVGFLEDWRRLNVAVTRAKRGLVIVGDSSTLSCDPNWRALIDWCKREGVFVTHDVADMGEMLTRFVKRKSVADAIQSET